MVGKNTSPMDPFGLCMNTNAMITANMTHFLYLFLLPFVLCQRHLKYGLKFDEFTLEVKYGMITI